MLKGIVSISGQQGLFKVVAEAKNRMIVESLVSGQRMAAGVTAKISSLEDIAIFTLAGELPLRDIFKKMYDHENGGKAFDPKSGEKEIRRYFGLILPDYDPARVYVSDIKKMLSWYNLLHEKEMLHFTEVEEEPAARAAEGETPSEEV